MESITKRLCEQAGAGDSEAYDRLFALHTDRALLFIRSRLGPKLRSCVETRDVLQDAYLAAHQAFSEFTYSDDGAFMRWLCRLIDRRLCDLGDHFGALKRTPVDIPRLNRSGPLTQLDRAEHREKVARAMEQLSDDHRQVLLLRFFEGLSVEEVGQRMQRTPGAVRSLTSRALAELGKQSSAILRKSSVPRSISCDGTRMRGLAAIVLPLPMPCSNRPGAQPFLRTRYGA